MAVHRKTEKIFLLKDSIFNEEKIKKLASEIKAVYPLFDVEVFVSEVVLLLPKQELMKRLLSIRDALKRHLPQDYKTAVAIIIEALPPALDNNKSDNDFGDFIYAPYSYYVAEYGCNKEHLAVSLNMLEEITKRFSAEASLRSFLSLFPEETYLTVAKWANSSDYHVRRLVSEGTRPNLPWAKKINYNQSVMLPILDILHTDKTRYVTRSVANHLNDVSKFAPDAVLDRLMSWQKLGKQNDQELSFIIRHSLRTLIKAGNTKVLALLGYNPTKIKTTLILADSKIKVGESIEFSLKLTNQEKSVTNLLVHYVIYFKKANGTLSPKVFLAKKLKLNPVESITIKKSHSLKPMTTRVLYTGEHRLEIRVNGIKIAKEKFFLE